MKNREFYITDDGIRLHAKIDFPEEWETVSEEDAIREKRPMVIVIHGITVHMEETHIIGAARTVNEAGMISLRAEMYGHGMSDGQFEDHTLLKWMTNAIAVTEYARSLPYVSDLYLCGHSQGGLLTVLTGGMFPDVFKALIPLAPATMIPEGARQGMLLGISFDPVSIPDVLRSEDGRTLKGTYVRAAQTIYPEYAMKRYHGPVLIVHADTDESVPYQCALEALSSYEKAELVTIRDDTHCFDRHLDEVLAAMKNFLTGMK